MQNHQLEAYAQAFMGYQSRQIHYYPPVGQNHWQADQCHSPLGQYHRQADQYHPQVGEYHRQADQYHPQVGEHHRQADQCHPQVGEYHRQADQYPSQVGEYHQQADQYHPLVGQHHRQADQYHSTVGEYHWQADRYHSQVGEYHRQEDHYYSQVGQHHPPADQYHSQVDQYHQPADNYHPQYHPPADHLPILDDDDFRMFVFKIKKCSSKRQHDWTSCPYVHKGEIARRRDPRKYHYSDVLCQHHSSGSCESGDSCNFSHGTFEQWLHPARYRTRMCTGGMFCKRKVCFFAHTQKELRRVNRGQWLCQPPRVRVPQCKRVPQRRSSLNAAAEAYLPIAMANKNEVIKKNQELKIEDDDDGEKAFDWLSILPDPDPTLGMI